VKSPGIATATAPHCDSIYMGRGTPDCYTCWTPFSDVSLEMGGLMVLEGGYRDARFGAGAMREYARGDVDGHCATDGASAGLDEGLLPCCIPIFSFMWRIPTEEQIVVTNDSAPSSTQAAAVAAAQREARALTAEEAQLVQAAKRSSLAHPGTQQRLRNAHSVLDEGVGARWLTSTFEMGDVLMHPVHLHAAREHGQPHGGGPPELGHAVPAGERAGGRALGRGGGQPEREPPPGDHAQEGLRLLRRGEATRAWWTDVLCVDGLTQCLKIQPYFLDDNPLLPVQEYLYESRLK
jgi:hypothetical protein